MDLLKYLDLKGYNFLDCGSSPNQYAAKTICFKPNEDGAKEFNEIYSLCLSSDLGELIRTNKGAIAKCKHNHYVWDCRHNYTGGNITIYMYGRLYCFRLGYNSKTKETLPTYEAFAMFMSKCYELGIDLESYAIENGAEVKKTIEKPLIYIFEAYIGEQEHKNIHHLDFHSSYPSGLVNTHPEFRPVIEFFYNGRKENPIYKDVLNLSIGMMQSTNVKTIDGRWANLSKDAIADNNKRVKDLANKLIDSGRRIVGFNTDGIWYEGEIYHDENEGPNLGQWSNDHTNCTFRAKSSGAYEFIEDGKYYPVVRGSTNLDKDKPRENWKWGDIFKTSMIILEWDDAKGFKVSNENF